MSFWKKWKTQRRDPDKCLPELLRISSRITASDEKAVSEQWERIWNVLRDDEFKLPHKGWQARHDSCSFLWR